jgi:hypothetical protein
MNHSKFSIPELQVLMTNNSIALLLFLKSLLTGFIIGYLLLNSLALLTLFLIFEYLLNSFIPAYIPYNYLFKLIGQEINKRALESTGEYIEKVRLEKYFEEIPHTSKYERLAVQKYGSELLTFK